MNECLQKLRSVFSTVSRLTVKDDYLKALHSEAPGSSNLPSSVSSSVYGRACGRLETRRLGTARPIITMRQLSGRFESSSGLKI